MLASGGQNARRHQSDITLIGVFMALILIFTSWSVAGSDGSTALTRGFDSPLVRAEARQLEPVARAMQIDIATDVQGARLHTAGSLFQSGGLALSAQGQALMDGLAAAPLSSGKSMLGIAIEESPSPEAATRLETLARLADMIAPGQVRLTLTPTARKPAVEVRILSPDQQS